ncbi:MAG: hypothetical protein ACRDVG_16435 [Jatrophihabitantaceae bacterium]
MRVVERNECGAPVEEDYLRTGWTSSSRWKVNARLDPEQGAFVDSALAALADAEGLTRAEALVHLDAATLAKHVEADPAQCSREPAGRLAAGPGG